MSEYEGPSSRAALRARLGEQAFAEAEREGREAPAPSAQVIEAVRQVFALPAAVSRSRITSAA